MREYEKVRLEDEISKIAKKVKLKTFKQKAIRKNGDNYSMCDLLNQEIDNLINNNARLCNVEDIINKSNYHKYEYSTKYVVNCKCGKMLVLKDRKPYEKVKIICPKCGEEIIYGG